MPAAHEKRAAGRARYALCISARCSGSEQHASGMQQTFCCRSCLLQGGPVLGGIQYHSSCTTSQQESVWWLLSVCNTSQFAVLMRPLPGTAIVSGRALMYWQPSIVGEQAVCRVGLPQASLSRGFCGVPAAASVAHTSPLYLIRVRRAPRSLIGIVAGRLGASGHCWCDC